MGGMCEIPLEASTKEEMLAKGMEHLKESHPGMYTTVTTMAPENPMMVAWRKKFDAVWEGAGEA